MTLEEFEAEYDFKRPGKSSAGATVDKTIVFTCQSGFQASQAAHQLLQNGYVNLAFYQGDNMRTLWFFLLTITGKDQE